jgi:hypothetical protein
MSDMPDFITHEGRLADPQFRLVAGISDSAESYLQIARSHVSTSHVDRRRHGVLKQGRSGTIAAGQNIQQLSDELSIPQANLRPGIFEAITATYAFGASEIASASVFAPEIHNFNLLGKGSQKALCRLLLKEAIGWVDIAESNGQPYRPPIINIAILSVQDAREKIAERAGRPVPTRLHTDGQTSSTELVFLGAS